MNRPVLVIGCLESEALLVFADDNKQVICRFFVLVNEKARQVSLPGRIRSSPEGDTLL